jgi:hypothetical protein
VSSTESKSIATWSSTGVSESEAKTDLCRTMADRKIDVRVRIAPTDYGMRGQVFSDGNVDVPPHLKPGDLDWVQSRPFGQWPIGPKPGEHYSWISGWKNRPLDLIEVSTADVIAILCGGAGTNDISSATARTETAAINDLASHLRADNQMTRTAAAEWCRKSGHNLGKRAFDRVWPQAREKADLERIGKPGRKRKSTR